MINRNGYFWLEALSRNEDFTETCPLQERLVLERYDIELTLRFVVLEAINIADIADVPDLSVFLTTKLREIFSKPNEDLTPVADRFIRTFAALQQACGENAMRKFNAVRDRFTGPFLISAFELVALGVAHNIDHVERKGREWLAAKIKGIWADPRTEGIYGRFYGASPATYA